MHDPYLKVPTKFSFFIWTEALRKIFTIDNLRRWKLVVVDWCCMCKRNGETIDHLLLHCLVAQELWNMVCSLFGAHWVMLCSVVKLWQVGLISLTDSKLRCFGVWSLIFLCGPYGGKGMHLLLKGMKGRFMSWSTSSFRLCWMGKCFGCCYFHFSS